MLFPLFQNATNVLAAVIVVALVAVLLYPVARRLFREFSRAWWTYHESVANPDDDKEK